jgi:large subunit ribosomal protein L18e|tara:strand:+ start:1888 stop:2220 length:333 start_codon:yes stop_codon:yes gene_type:complete
MLETNYELIEIKKKARSNKAKIWQDIVHRLDHVSEINLYHISKITKSNDVVVVPGKVLGDGVLTHSVTIGALSYTKSAKNKIKEAGGISFSIPELITKYPEGNGVKIIVG